ncbi:MAG TPA: hypothetical protein VFQ57_10160 [Sphingomonas sp.]|nr:hypothetical protein [Sphingomonas sp.]
MKHAILGAAMLALLSGCSQSRPAGDDYLVYVTNEGSGDISVIDPAKRTEIARIPIGKRPRGLVASPDGRLLYVAVSGSPAAGPGVDETKLPPPDKGADGIAVIDLARRTIVRTLRGISDPEQVAISPDGQRLYVASEDRGVVVVIDRDGRKLAELAVGGEPEGIGVSPDGASVLATSEEDSSVAILRGSPLKVVARVGVGSRPRNATFVGAARAVVPGETDASISIVDVAAGTRTRTIILPPTDRPMGVAALDGHTVLLTTGRGGRLVKIDIDKADAVIGAATVGTRPWGVAVAPDRRLAFTANGPSGDVTIVDTATMKVTAKVKVGTGPWGATVVRQ